MWDTVKQLDSAEKERKRETKREEERNTVRERKRETKRARARRRERFSSTFTVPRQRVCKKPCAALSSWQQSALAGVQRRRGLQGDLSEICKPKMER